MVVTSRMIEPNLSVWLAVVTEPKVFGVLLRSVRERYGLSQRQLSVRSDAEFGLSPAYISRIESGDRQIGINGMIALSRILPIKFEIDRGIAHVNVPSDAINEKAQEALTKRSHA